MALKRIFKNRIIFEGMKDLIVASTSTVYGSGYLEYLKEAVTTLFENVPKILFIPYARPGGITHAAYTSQAAGFFKGLGKEVKGLHEFKDPARAIDYAEGIFTGGGNTFVLVDQLYQNKVMQPLREAIFAGVPYLGTSAGSNICGLNMQTTNDMPIVYPPSFKTIGALPFNINAHYLDPDPDSTHMGETRETRIKEFHTQQHIPVVGLREGSWLKVKADQITLKGALNARIFKKGKTPYEVKPGTKIELV